jgi:hypothetical protein
MKRLFTLSLIALILMPFMNYIMAQEKSAVEVKFNGFVKTDIIYDTRQNLAIREGHFYILPLDEVLDANGDDINATPNFNILNVQTRGMVSISVPDVLGAKATGYIEGAFFGSAEGNINTFRLRHAFGKLDWGSTVLLIGQYWHPMFITECFPDVVSFNTGAPFQPFTRNPQIRLQQYIGDLRLELTAASQRDFASTGPNGGSSQYLRNAVIPDLNFGMQYKFGKSLIGAAAEYKTLLPRMSYTYMEEGVSTTVKTDETVGSYAVMGYGKLAVGDFQLKSEAVYGQNLTNMTMIGGYYQVGGIGDLPTYSPDNILSVWGELIYGKDLQFGLFGGYAQNSGSDEAILTDKFSRAPDIEYIYRVSPRIVWNLDKFRFAFEIEYTSAAYGEVDYNDHAKVKDAKDIPNLRALVAAYVFF